TWTVFWWSSPPPTMRCARPSAGWAHGSRPATSPTPWCDAADRSGPERCARTSACRWPSPSATPPAAPCRCWMCDGAAPTVRRASRWRRSGPGRTGPGHGRGRRGAGMSGEAGAVTAEELPGLLDLVREDLVRSPGTVDVPRVARVLRRQGRVLGAAATLELTARIRDHVDGLGVLQELVAPGVTDLLVNDDGTVWVDDAAGLRRTAHRLGPAQAR